MIVKEKPLITVLYPSQNPFEDIKTMSMDKKTFKNSSSKALLFCRYIGMEHWELL